MWFIKNKNKNLAQAEILSEEINTDIPDENTRNNEPTLNFIIPNAPTSDDPTITPPKINGANKKNSEVSGPRSFVPIPTVPTKFPPDNQYQQKSQYSELTETKPLFPSSASESTSKSKPPPHNLLSPETHATNDNPSISRLGPVKNTEKTLTVSAVREVAKDVFMENFPRLRQVAHVEAERRIELFLSELDVRLSRSLSSEQVNKFNDPAILHSLNQALQATALQNEVALRKILADLIVKRVLEDESSLKRIVYTEAIKTVPLLTSEMLDMLTLTFLIRRAHILDINDWNDFRSRVWPFIEQFLVFRGTQAELQHLEYAGCGIVAPSAAEESDVIRILRASYSILFQRGMSFDEAKALRIPESAITDAIYADDTEVCYKFKFRSKAELDAFFRHHPELSPGTKQRIATTFEKCMGSLESSYDRLISEVPSAAALVNTWNNSPIRFLDPTSVGLVIGATHFEGRTGQQVPIDVWIN